MRIYDASLPLSRATVTWPGDPPFNRIEKKTSAITSRLDLPSHFGTHIDAPRHFLFRTGGVDSIPAHKLVGQARVIVSRSRSSIGEAEARRIKPLRGEKIFFKTRNSSLLGQKKFTSDYVSLSLPAARYLASRKIDLVGIDYFGIEAKSAPGHPVHKTLLQAGIVIVEGVDLRRVPPGRYQTAALPLKIQNGDGSPARVLLWK